MAELTDDQITQGLQDDNPNPQPPPVQPSFVPADEFKQFQQIVTGTLGTIQESLQAMNNSRPAPAPVHAPTIEDATDEEIESALAQGMGAKVFRKLVNAATAKLDAKYDRRASELESIAGTSIAALSTEIATPKMKYYGKIPVVKKEVDALIAGMPSNTRLDPKNQLIAYNAVVGAHMDEVLNYEREEAARAANNNPGTLPGSANGRANASPTEPTVKEVFGEESERELQSRGRNIDTLAKAFGFKDGKEYMKYARDGEVTH